ncbi:MAG: hypothetical protein K9L30_15290 [Desulfobacterales bacterium]|nr:hypothetical protein [Desulfobacterales bacterium]
MKLKYVITRDEQSNTLKIQEFAKLEKEMKRWELSGRTQDDYTLLYEESFDDKTVKNAIKDGREALISAIRTSCFYPASEHAAGIAESLTSLFGKKKTGLFFELNFDDNEKYKEKLPPVEDHSLTKQQGTPPPSD